MIKEMIAEKDRLVREYKLHRYFLLDDYHKPHQNSFLKWLQDTIEDKNAAILDVGCGVGFLALRLHEIGYDNYHGIDINGKRIEAARKLLARFDLKPRLWVERGEHTHFRDGQFDVVCMLDTPDLHMGAACKEAHRVLKHGGYLVVASKTHTKREMERYLKLFVVSECVSDSSDQHRPLKFCAAARKCG